MRKALLLFCAAAAGVLSVAAQGRAEGASSEPIILWPEGAPGALGDEEADIPTLTPFPAPPDNATGAAVIVDTWSDRGVPVENSLMFANALRKAEVPCEIHIYEQGPHNFLLAAGETRRVLDTWWDHLADWLRLHGFAAPGQGAPPPS
jgi:acetyl esterase/lipase